MATLDGSHSQKFTNRQSIPLKLPVMEPKDSAGGYRKERLHNEYPREGHPSSGGEKRGASRPASRQKRPSSRGESKSSGSTTPDRLPSGGATPERPSSALARGVKIMEHSDSRVNPEPQVPEEAEVLLEEYLSPRKLRALTGLDDLDQVEYLEMKVDTRDTSLGNFGSHVPNLCQLKLSNSIISTVRDLGSCLDHMKVLWMARAAVEDLDGLPAMTSLQELYLAYNEISDISPCSMLDNLQILDLEGNNIDNMQQIHYLSLCSALQNLTLDGNPVCVTPSPDEADPTYNYRGSVKSVIPHLKLLDDLPLLENELQRSNTGFEDDWKLIEEMMEEGLVVGAEDTVKLDVPNRPGTGVRTTTSYRPGSALKPYTSLRPDSRQGTAGRRDRPGTRDRPGSGRLRGGERLGSGGSSGGSRPGTSTGRRLNSEDGAEEDMSGLTLGGVVCGSPSKALRARRGNKPSTLRNNPKLMEQLRQTTAESGADVELGEIEDMKEIMDEVSEWRKGHSKRRAEIEASRVPQVLTIDHDEAEEVSGNEISTEEDSEEDDIWGSRSQQGHKAEKEKDPLKAFRGTRPKIKDPREASKRFISPASMRRMRQTFEESVEAHEEEYTPTHTPPTPPDSRLMNRLSGGGASLRASTGLNLSSPVPAHPRNEFVQTPPDSGYHSQRKPKYTSSLKEAKVVERSNPVIRATPLTPEGSHADSLIVAPSKAAIKQPQLTKIRKGQLANVQLLPSRFPKQRDNDGRKS